MFGAHSTCPHVHVSPCTESSGFAWVCPQPEEIVTNRQQDCLRLPTTPTVQGGWTTCARVRRLSMPIACLSSAMASGSHGTGHGVAVGRGRSGRRLSGVRALFSPFVRTFLGELLLYERHIETPPPRPYHVPGYPPRGQRSGRSDLGGGTWTPLQLGALRLAGGDPPPGQPT